MVYIPLAFLYICGLRLCFKISPPRHTKTQVKPGDASDLRSWMYMIFQDIQFSIGDLPCKSQSSVKDIERKTLY